jgi:hypothetical protein
MTPARVSVSQFKRLEKAARSQATEGGSFSNDRKLIDVL